MAENIEFNLKVISDNLKKSLEDNIQRAGKLDVALGSAVGAFAGGVAVKGFELLGSAIGNVGALLKKGIAEAEQEEKALNNLANALKRTGEFSNFAIQGFADFSDELARTSAFNDDEIISQLALAKSLGATNEQAKQLVSGAAQLSVILNQDLGTSTEQLAKTFSGAAGRLAAFLPELKQLTKEQLQAGAAIDFVNQKFGGAAVGQLATYSGATNQAEKAFDNFLESVGNFVVKNPAVISTINLTTNGLIKLAEATNSAAKFFGIGITPIEEQKAKLAELGQQYNILTDRIKQRNELAAQAGGLGNTEREQVYLKQAAELELQRNNILKERQAIRSNLSADQAKSTENPQINRAIDEQTLAQRAQLNSDLLTLDQQYNIEKQRQDAEFAILQSEEGLARQEARIAVDLNFKEMEIQAAYEAELRKNALIGDAESKRLADKKSAAAKELAVLKAKTDAEIKQQILQEQFEKQLLSSRLQAASGFLQAGITLAKQGSREQKALQIAQATVSTYTAATQALSSPPGPPYTFPLVASVIAQGLANVSKISSQSFASGGIIGATNGGDNRVASVRDGEMVLNASQQKKLFDFINNGSGAGEIVVQVDGKEIARAVRNQVEQGFKVV